MAKIFIHFKKIISGQKTRYPDKISAISVPLQSILGTDVIFGLQGIQSIQAYISTLHFL